MRHKTDEAWVKTTKSFACGVYHFLRLPLPSALKTFYIDQIVYGKIYPDAHRRYRPQPYSGRVVYFKSEDTRVRVAGWQKLMTDGLEIRSVTGNHLSMLVEPNLKTLAETLKGCLTEAQRSH